VIIALAGVSVSLFSLANHYHDSKYKAQYKIVSTLCDSIRGSNGFQAMIDSDIPAHERYADTVYVDVRIKQAQSEALAIDAMYSRGSEESDAFTSIERAFGQMEHVVAAYENKLFYAFQLNMTYESNTTINALLMNASQEMSDLVDLIFAGIDQSRDWNKSPYSLVKRMDLAEIVNVSARLEGTAHELRLLLP
jgi:hypothetical protein